MSWGKVKHPSDVVRVGDAVSATIISIDKEKGKISLTLKDLKNEPWKTVTEKYPVGNIVGGKVVRLVPFGAFIELEDGVDGLVHISQISYERIAKPEDVLKVGEVIQVKILEVNQEQKKISLSKKETEEAPVVEKAPTPEPAAEEPVAKAEVAEEPVVEEVVEAEAAEEAVVEEETKTVAEASAEVEEAEETETK